MAELKEANIKSAVNGDVLRDAEIHGLHLRCFPTKKVFYIYFRTKRGQERRPKLGNYGQLTLTQARTVAKAMLQEVAAGKDPQAIRAGERAEPTVTDLWAEFWKRHASKKKSSAGDLTNWNKHLAPALGRLRLSEVTYERVGDLHEDMSESHPILANRVLALASTMFNFAHRPLKWVAVSDNPCKGVKRNKETKRRRKASREELARIVARLRKELDGPNVASAAFVWLLLFTGARKGEIASAKWSHVQGNRILLDEHKTDDGGYARIIYLPPAALEVLDQLPLTTGTLTGVLSPKKFWATVCEQENLPDLTLHDLRRTFASVALSTGQLSLEQVMQMLGHTSAQTTKVYAWLMEDTATDAAGLVAERMLG